MNIQIMLFYKKDCGCLRYILRYVIQSACPQALQSCLLSPDEGPREKTVKNLAEVQTTSLEPFLTGLSYLMYLGKVANDLAV